MSEINLKQLVILLVGLILFVSRILSFKTPEFPNGTRIEITSSLKTTPVNSGNIQTFTISALKVITWKYPQYTYGQRLKIAGIVKNNSLEFPKIEIINYERKRNIIIESILNLRQRIDETYKKYLPEPEASLLSGIVLGMKSEIPKDFYNNLMLTGTTHVVVASGMNIALVSGTILSILLNLFSRRTAAILSTIFIWIYTLMAGGDVPVVRAAIMGTLVLLAMIIGREFDALRALLVAGVILIFINPTSIFDIGFQLSFASTLGIILMPKIVSKHLFFLPKRLNNDLSQTLSAQLFTLPIVLSTFGFYSLLSPLVNLLVVWPLVWILRLGLLIGVTGLIWEPLGQVLAWLTLPLLTYFVQIVNVFARI